MQWFIDGLKFQCESHGVAVELIMVEWNPPPDRADLATQLRWPKGSDLRGRVITVPADIHQQFKGSDRLPLYQMIAKNVGIRRASAPYVLATNIDILFSDELFRAMTGSLRRDTVYRADRHDVDFPLHATMSVPEALAYCADHPLRTMRRDGAYYPGRGRVLPNYQSLLDYGVYQSVRLSRRLTRGGAETEAIASPAHAGRPALTPSAAATWLAHKAEAAVDLVRLPRLHTNACGDFTLISRDVWFEMHGYPEWAMYSWNLDSFVLYQAAASGAAEVDLPDSMPLFHMEHAKGSGWTPEGRGDLFGRLERNGVGYLTDRGLRLEARRLLRETRRGAPTPVNDDGWGLIEHELSDRLVGS
jgi:hypothetical protein